MVDVLLAAALIFVCLLGVVLAVAAALRLGEDIERFLSTRRKSRLALGAVFYLLSCCGIFIVLNIAFAAALDAVRAL